MNTPAINHVGRTCSTHQQALSRVEPERVSVGMLVSLDLVSAGGPLAGKNT